MLLAAELITKGEYEKVVEITYKKVEKMEKYGYN